MKSPDKGGDVVELHAVISEAGDRIELFRAGESAPRVVQRAERDRRPYIHPIAAPDGCGILTEDAPPHHPWQHGLYVGLNDVNGIGFWTEGLTGPGAARDGTFHPNPMAAPEVSGGRASWAVETEWRGPEGSPMILERQCWTLADHGEACDLDLDWTLTAVVDLTFGRYDYGGLFLRMPFRGEGAALNSEGRINGEPEAQRARWVAISMPIDGRRDPAGIAMMDHPSNPEYPVTWRVDGQLGVAPSRCIAGEWRLARGETARFRHRLYAYCGGADRATIESSWKAFTGKED